MSDYEYIEYINRMKNSQSVDVFFDIFKELVNTKTILPQSWFIKCMIIVLDTARRIDDQIMRVQFIETMMTFLKNNYSNWRLEESKIFNLSGLFYSVFWKVHNVVQIIEKIDIPQESIQKFIHVIQDVRQTCFPIDVVKKMCPHDFMSSCFLYHSNNSFNTDVIIEYLENMSISFVDRRDPKYVENVISLKKYIKTLHGENHVKWNRIFRSYVQLSIENHCVALTCAGSPCTLPPHPKSQVCSIHTKKYTQIFNAILKHTKIPIDLVHLSAKFAL